jgi:LEA14-like dessication related protein
VARAQSGAYAARMVTIAPAPLARIARRCSSLLAVVLLSACATLPSQDPLNVDVAGIDPLPGEGLELRLAVHVRIQNPNDAPVEYSGAALTLDLNDRKLATGVSAVTGVVPRYGEAVLTIPVTISALSMARQVIGFANASGRNEVRYRVRGKLEGGLLGTRRFEDTGAFALPASGAAR